MSLLKTFWYVIICCFLAFLGLQGCVNPFAPAIIDSNNNIVVGDPKTIEGFFQSFAYSYNMQDTVVYSSLLAEDFTFAYRNYDLGMNFSWNREEDMLTTHRLFEASQSLDFMWNETVMQNGDDTSHIVLRNFDLSIVFNHSDAAHINGRTYFILKRKSVADNWMLFYWRDESYY